MRQSPFSPFIKLLAGASVAVVLAGASRAQSAGLFSYTTPAYLQFNSPSYSAAPGQTNAVITILRTGEFRIPVTVNYSTRAGSAVAGEDYITTQGSLRIPAGVGFASFAVSLVPDRIVATEKTVQLSLSNPGPGGQITGGNATLRLRQASAADSDSLPKLSLRAVGPGQVIVSWPDDGTSYFLERASDPCQGSWARVNASTQIADGKCQVTEAVENGPVFYRLRGTN